MKKLLLLSIFFSCLTILLKAEVPANDIADRLVKDGFENVRVNCSQNRIFVALEDNHYRDVSYGLAMALKIISPDKEDKDTIELIALENQMPRLTVHAIHNSEDWIINTEYGGDLNRHLKEVKSMNPSAYKVDIVAYQSMSFGNFSYDKLWSFAGYIAPAIEMNLWKGAKVTVQTLIPIWNNFNNHRRYQKLKLGYIALSQQILSDEHWDVKATLGIFNFDRNGLDIRGNYHINKSLDVGIIAGYTGPWYVKDHKLTLCYWDKVNLLANINYYEPRTNLQFNLKAGQFVYEDLGVRLDVLRHYREFAIGLYGCTTELGTNLGFEFSIPFGPKKMGQHRAVRLRLPNTFHFNFDENIDYSNGNKSDDKIGQLYKTAPDQNYSAHYWQPELIKDNILFHLEAE